MRLTSGRVPGADAEHQNDKNESQHNKLGEPGWLETFSESSLIVFSLVGDMNDRVAMKISNQHLALYEPGIYHKDSD